MTVIWQPALDEEAARWHAVAELVTQRAFAPLAYELDRDQRYPWETCAALVEHKFTGLFIPRVWRRGPEPARDRRGGRDDRLPLRLDGGHHVRLPAWRVSDPAGRHAGAEEPLPARDDARARDSFALSERIAGSDAAAIEATAVREGDGWRLKGEKYWIGNGGASRYYVVFAKTDPALGGRGICAFMVDKEQPGAVIDELSDKMGIRGTQTPI